MWELMFPQTLAPFVLTLIRRANVESKYDYYQARCFELEKVLEKQQMKEMQSENDFYIWLYKTLAVFCAGAFAVIVGEIYRLSVLNNVSLFIIGFLLICSIIVLMMFVLFCIALKRKLTWKWNY